MNIESTVCFFRDLFKTLDAIPDEDAGILMKAVFAHANGQEPDFKDSSLAKALYIGIADQVDRLDQFRKAKQDAGRRGGIASGQTRSKTKQNEAKRSNAKQSEPPYPYPNPYPNISRNPKIQKAYGFSTERKDVNYNDIVRERMSE